LHPRYWLTWLGIGLLYVLVLLPYPVIYRLGTGLGRFSMRFLKRRVHIAQRNLELCFPEMSAAERDERVRQNFESVGMGLFETGMAWFWPEWRVRHWFTVTGEEHIAQAKASKQGVLLVGSGSITHNLHDFRDYQRGGEAPYVRPFVEWVEQRLQANDSAALLDYRRQAPYAERAHPTDEHFQPLHFALGAAGGEVLGAQRIDAGIDAGMLAMDIYRFDGEAA